MDFPFEQDLTLENDVALLRPLQASDVEYLLDIALQDKQLLQFSPTPIHSEELLHHYIKNAVQARLNKNRYPFIIFDKRVNQYAGSTSYLAIDAPNQRLEIGATWLGRDFQKTGLNRYCKYLLLSFAFDDWVAERVEFRTDERNQASRAAIEKIGGQFEGILRSHTIVYDGLRRNTVCYSILKSEWAFLKAGFLIQ